MPSHPTCALPRIKAEPKGPLDEDLSTVDLAPKLGSNAVDSQGSHGGVSGRADARGKPPATAESPGVSPPGQAADKGRTPEGGWQAGQRARVARECGVAGFVVWRWY